MKLALVLPANRFFCPYHNIYCDILELHNIDYDVIYFDKQVLYEEGLGFRLKWASKYKSNKIVSLLNYYLYSRFVEQSIALNKYDKIVVFSSQLAILLSSFLIKNYNNNYVIDFRDLSIEQKLKKLFYRVAKKATFISISSPGFKKFLPKDLTYELSHNFRLWNANEKAQDIKTKQKLKINILTIGALRDYSSNIEIIKAFANKSHYQLSFVGDGPSASLLKKYCKEKGIINVHFYGFYQKELESYFIQKSDILNIYYPRTDLHDSAISNRFYNGLYYKKPMIVTDGGVQGKYIKDNGLGVSISSNDDIYKKVECFVKTDYNKLKFKKSADKLLNDFYLDYLSFKNRFSEFLNIKNDTIQR